MKSGSTAYIVGYDQNLLLLDLLRHPVLATFVSLKWKKIRGLFYFQSFIYLLFLICYSAFIGYWFTRPEKYCMKDTMNTSVDPCSIAVLNSTEALDRLHSKLFEGPHASVTFLEATLLITSVSLLVSEIIQMIYLKKLYFLELENYIELYILVSAIVAMCCKEDMLLQNTKAAVTRGVLALGISFGGKKMFICAIFSEEQ